MDKLKPRPNNTESTDPIEKINKLTQRIGTGVFLGAVALGATGLAVLAATGVGLDKFGGTVYDDVKKQFKRPSKS